jgi:hypothetical protein
MRCNRAQQLWLILVPRAQFATCSLLLCNFDSPEQVEFLARLCTAAAAFRSLETSCSHCPLATAALQVPLARAG